MVKMNERSLVEQSAAFWQSRERTGKQGLILLDKLMHNVAEHRDWNGLARFLQGAKAAKQDAIVKRLVFHVFGNNLVVKVNAKHPTGVTFVMKWDGALDLSQSNSYSTIRAAIDKGLSWDDVSLFKSLSKPDPKTKTVDPARYQAEAKRIAKMLDKLAQEGLLVGDILSAADKLREVRNAPVDTGVSKRVVNGVTIIDDVDF